MSIRNGPIPAVSQRNGMVVMFPADTPDPYCPRAVCPTDAPEPAPPVPIVASTPQSSTAEETTAIVLKADGSPYATEATAASARASRGLDGTVVEVDGGFGIEVKS